MARRLISLGLAAAVLAAAFFTFNKLREQRAANVSAGQDAPPERSETAFSVRFLKAAPGAHAPLLYLIGRVTARERAVLSSPLEADILKAPAREGDYVDAGQRLVVLDLRALDLDRDIRQSQLDDLDAQLRRLSLSEDFDRRRLADLEKLLQFAEESLAREKRLLAAEVSTPQKTEQAEQSVTQRRLELLSVRDRLSGYAFQQRQLQAAMSQTESALEQLSLTRERALLAAPYRARVAKVHAKAGNRARPGEALVEIYDDNTMLLEAEIPQRHLAQLRKKDAHLTLGKERQFARVALSHFSPVVEGGQSGVKGFFALPGRDWVTGEVVEAALALGEEQDTVLLPPDAVYGGDKVYRITADSRAEAVACRALGVAVEAVGEPPRALLRCPALLAGDRVVTIQLPGLINGALLKPLSDGVEITATDGGESAPDSANAGG